MHSVLAKGLHKFHVEVLAVARPLEWPLLHLIRWTSNMYLLLQ